MSKNQVKDKAALIGLIKQCLEKNPSAAQLDRSVHVLLPVVNLLAEEEYNFVEASSLDLRQIRKAMGPLIGKKKFSLSGVSVSKTKGRLWNIGDAPELELSFSKALYQNFRGVTFVGFGAGPHIIEWGFGGWNRDIERFIRQSCRSYHWMGGTAGTDEDSSFMFYRDVIVDSFRIPIMLYLALLSRGDPRASEFEPLFQILPKTIPLGNRLTNKREWLVLTA